MFSAANQIAEAELFFGAMYLYSVLFDWVVNFDHPDGQNVLGFVSPQPFIEKI